MKPVCFFVLLVLCTGSFAQSTNQKPCSAPQASQFDFWIGDWNLAWSDTVHGTNHIEKMWGNCTVHESFSDAGASYLGQSWSVYNANYKVWQQTWVDNAGGYTQVTGGMVGDSMILFTQERQVPANISATGKMKNRMVYYNIKPDSFDWSWEASTDGGQTWKPNWQIHYERKK